MKKNHLICLSIAITIFSSCSSSLRVEVHSFDMDRMRAMPEFNRVKNDKELENYNAILLGGYFEKLSSHIYAVVKDSLSNDSAFSLAAVPKTMVIVQRKVDSTIARFKDSTIAVRDALGNYIKVPTERTKALYDTSYSRYIFQAQGFSLFLKRLADEVGASDQFGFSLAQDYTRYSNAHHANFTFGTSIADDAMASFVAKAPEEFWRKYKSSFYPAGTDISKHTDPAMANETEVKTFFGNSDIAIKMDDPANFVIKGVRLDADAAFRTSFKVLSQGIKYLTYAAGIPATPASGSSNAPAVKIPELANLSKNKKQLETLNNNYQTLTDAFLKILDANKADLIGADATKRQSAINAIKDAYTFYKSQLPTQKPITP